VERQNGPWRIKQRRHIYDNPHLTFYEDEVIQPDGKPGRFAVVEVPAGVSVLPV
jgi:ADP-ribose pyrophosphatase